MPKTQLLAADLEVRSAAVIDPDSLAIVAPASSLLAGRVAVLHHELHAAASVGGTIVLVHIV